MPYDIQAIRSMHDALQEQFNGMHEDDPEFLATMDNVARANRLIAQYDEKQRKTDANGKLTADVEGSLPSSVGPDSYNYHFEPSVAEVQDRLRRDPAYAKSLGIEPEWINGIAVPEKTEQVTDITTGQTQGQTVTPAKTHLDLLTKDQSAYKAVARDLWKKRMTEAQAKGEGVKRYKDVDVRENPGHYLLGGAEHVITQRLFPLGIGLANSFSSGTAAPLYDTLGDLSDYEHSRDQPIPYTMLDQSTGQPIGQVPQSAVFPENLPKSREIVNRSPELATVGEVAGYGFGSNPTNFVQRELFNVGMKQAAKTAGEGLVRDVVMPAASSAVAGGLANATEGYLGEFARAGNEGDPIDVGAARAAKTVVPNLITGGIGGVGGDVGGQLAEAGSGSIRNRVPDIDTLREGGGDTRFIRGAKPPPEVDEITRQHREMRREGKVPIGYPDRVLANKVAPDIERSIERQSVEQNTRIGNQVQEYYTHPAYRDRKINALPAVRGLIGLAGEGWTADRATGGVMNVDQPLIKKIGGVLSSVARPRSAPKDQSARLAQSLGGMVIDSRLANELELYKLDGSDPFPENQDVILVPTELTAQTLTKLEGRIDTELNQSSARGAKEDPAWDTLNQGVKDMRDQFPLYRDENGNLVAPPREGSSAPFRPEAGGEPLAGDVEVLPRPRSIEPGIPVDADKPGLHPGAGPQVPENPFEPNPYMRVFRDDLDRGPIEPRPRVSIEPEPQPPPFYQEASPGVGPTTGGSAFDPARRVPRGQSALGDPNPVDVSRTESVEGGYWPRPAGEGPTSELPPQTPRQPFEVKTGWGELAKRPGDEVVHQPVYQGEFVDEISPDATPLSLLAGNGLAIREVPPSTTRNRGGRDQLAPVVVPHRFLGGHLESQGVAPDSAETYARTLAERDALEARQLAPAEPPLNGPLMPEYDPSNLHPAYMIDEPPELFHDGYTEPMRREPTERMLPPERPDERGPLERSLDAQLGDPNQSLPTPTGKEWNDEGIELWYEKQMEPGRDPRSEESKRMADLTAQQSAYEEAEAQVRDIEERLGKMDDKSRLQSLINIVSNKIGRQVTKEDLVRAGILSAGAAAMLTSDDEDVQAGGAAAMVLGGGGNRFGRRSAPPGGPTSIMDDMAARAPRKPPTQPEFTLPNGKTVRGFGALRHEQHEAKNAIEKSKARVGAGGEATLERRVLNFNQGKNTLEQDRALADEAAKIGKSKELQTAAAAGAYNRLSGIPTTWERFKAAAGVRADRLLDLLSGAKANSFAADPSGFEKWLRESLNLRGGRTGARYGDIQAIHRALFGPEKKKEEKERKAQ